MTYTRGVLLTAVVLAIWGALAARSPELTYHFAPLIAGAVGPISIRREEPRPLREAAIVAALSTVAVSSFAVGLWLLDWMRGPTFVGDSGAVLEAILFAVVGAAFGARVAARRRQGLVGSLFGS